MAERTDILCPQCGRKLGSTVNDCGGGTKTCANCRITVRFEVSGNRVRTSKA